MSYSDTLAWIGTAERKDGPTRRRDTAKRETRFAPCRAAARIWAGGPPCRAAAAMGTRGDRLHYARPAWATLRRSTSHLRRLVGSRRSRASATERQMTQDDFLEDFRGLRPDDEAAADDRALGAADHEGGRAVHPHGLALGKAAAHLLREAPGVQAGAKGGPIQPQGLRPLHQAVRLQLAGVGEERVDHGPVAVLGAVRGLGGLERLLVEIEREIHAHVAHAVGIDIGLLEARKRLGMVPGAVGALEV